MKVAIIGAGAAGCFCAVNLRRLLPAVQIDVYESGQRPLQKVAVTGGGRCNLTNTFADVRSLSQVYPRGSQLMKRLLRRFDQRQTMQWFEAEGVRLVVQDDQCVFPQSQDAMQIVSTLLRGMQGVRILCRHRVTALPEGYDAIVVTTGGSPRQSGLSFLSSLSLDIVPPVPSLFAFTVADTTPLTPLSDLMGTVVASATVGLAGTKLKAEGTLLITHWGLSGPAILRLSSYAARWLAERSYQATLCVNWMAGRDEQNVRQELSQLLADNGSKHISSLRPLTERHWRYLLQKVGIAPDRRCAEIGSKQLNRLASVLVCDTYQVTGKNPHREEFVTCGGVALTNINPNTLECVRHPGIYFAGEVLDVDAVTGGFNLQAAWTMGRVVAESICQNATRCASNASQNDK